MTSHNYWKIKAAMVMALVFGIVFTGQMASGAEKSATGIPRVIDYGADIETWWANHPLNPESPKCLKQISSPEPVITLKEGESIQEAIEYLPRTGGTIRLEPGTYRAFRIIGRSHVHVLGPEQGEAIILCGNRSVNIMIHIDRTDVGLWTELATLRPAPGSYRFHYTSRMHWEINKNPIRDFYFKNLIFDGEGIARPWKSVVNFVRADDVLLEQCTFRNCGVVYPPAGHPGIFCAANGENIWLRDCRLEGKNVHFTYMDGVQVAGVINCAVTCSNFWPSSRNFNFMHDYDRVSDWNENGQFERDELMTPQYIVLQGNTLNGDAQSFLRIEGFDALVCNNVCNGTLDYMAESHSVVPFMHGSFAPGAYNIRVIGNTARSVRKAIMKCTEYEHDKANVMALPKEKISVQRNNKVAGAAPREVEFYFINLYKFYPWYPKDKTNTITDLPVKP